MHYGERDLVWNLPGLGSLLVGKLLVEASAVRKINSRLANCCALRYRFPPPSGQKKAAPEGAAR
jgi:hypothetical protein